MCEINVKEFRDKKGLTQTELARIMGVSTQTVKNWEAGRTIPSTAALKLKEIAANEGPLTALAGYVTTDASVIEALTQQLAVKDKQIEEQQKLAMKSQEQIDRLLNIIEKLS